MISFINNKNKRGPKLDPCGMSEVIVYGLDFVLW